MPGKQAPLVERFWTKVEKTDACWLWKGAVISSNGYGTIGAGRGHNFLVHRLAYEWAYGSIPSGLLVCHACDNKLCVRADHLFLGTHKDNTQDMIRKGRQRMGITPYRIYRGVDHPQAKLTLMDIQSMRKRYALGGISFKKLGTVYGVCADAAWKAVTGKTYQEATPIPKEVSDVVQS